MQRFHPLFAASAFALIVSACQDASAPLAPIPASAPSAVADDLANSHVYIAQFRGDTPDAAVAARGLAAKYGGKVKHVYTALKGMAIEIPDVAVTALRAEPEITALVPDGVFTFAETQANPPWGLDRVDQRVRPLNNSYTYYANGTGVTVYIIDTGIDPSHPDFGGRASVGFDATGGNGVDCHGHGTHVAGTVGGSTYGVAKNVQLVGVKVFPNCQRSGDWSDFIAGVDWVSNNRAPRSVANVSLGGPLNFVVNAHVQTSIDAGVTYAIAAGNCTTDIFGNCEEGPYNACDRSPSSVTTAIIVAATNSSDQYAYFSNYGGCVSMNAPGVDITSAGLGGPPAVMSGTSMSSPHAAGAAAQYLSVNPSASPGNVRSALITNATPEVISGLYGGTPNRLLYSLFIGGMTATFAGPTYTSYQRVCDWSIAATGGTPPYTYSIRIQSQSFIPNSTTTASLSSRVYTTASTYVLVDYSVTDAIGQNLQETKVFNNVGQEADPYCHY